MLKTGTVVYDAVGWMHLMWLNGIGKDVLQKHNPRSCCTVTRISGQGRPLRQTVQQDEASTPLTAPSNTTTVWNSSWQPLQASPLSSQELKGLGIHYDPVEHLLEEQKDLRARLITLEALAVRVDLLEKEQQDSSMMHG